jgi:hypothetical protein
MPRKKTVQPEPLEIFELEDGTIVEIRDHDTRERGRGLDKQWKVDNAVDGILAQLIYMIQKGDRNKVQTAIDALEKPRGIPAFVKILHQWGYQESDRTLRKHVDQVRSRWKTLVEACRENGIDPYKRR